jgi:hypothetical protein
MMSQRPLGITIIAFVMGFSAVLGICGSLAGLGFSPFALFGENGGFGPMFSAGFASIVGLVLSLASLCVAWGLWTLQPWAFWATVIVEVLSLVNGGFSYSGGARGSVCGVAIIPLIVLIYLFANRNVRQAFRT